MKTRDSLSRDGDYIGMIITYRMLQGRRVSKCLGVGVRVSEGRGGQEVKVGITRVMLSSACRRVRVRECVSESACWRVRVGWESDLCGGIMWRGDPPQPPLGPGPSAAAP